MKNVIEFNFFVEAVGDSSARSRAIIVTLMTTTFLASLALYNSLPPDKNWLSSRLESMHKLNLWVVYPDENRLLNDSIEVHKELYQTLIPNPTGTQEIFKLHNLFTYKQFSTIIEYIKNDTISVLNESKIPKQVKFRFPPTFRNKLNGIEGIFNEDINECRAVINTVSKTTVISKDEVNELIYLYNKAKIDNSILIDIPIVGITFDINGLGLISTVGFGIIYFLLFYSLARERKNLRLVFKVANQYDVDEIKLYQILSMKHVLTVPRSIDEFISDSVRKKKSFLVICSRQFFRKLPLLPLVLPIILCFLIFRNDNATVDVGESVNSSLTHTNYYLTKLFGVFMVFMFFLCAKEWRNINKVYDEAIIDSLGKKKYTKNIKKSSHWKKGFIHRINKYKI